MGAPGSQATAAPAASAKTWLTNRAVVEAFLREGKVVGMTEVPVGVTKPMRCQFAIGLRHGPLVRIHRPDHRPAKAYGLPPSAFEMSAIARCARTLLPASSSGGEMTAMPNLPGDTAMIPPPTPLLAGRPV